MIMTGKPQSRKPIFLVGYMGCGKTTTGKRLAKKYGLDFIDLDHYIESRYFKTVSQLFQEKGESGFREIERDLLREVADFENVIISTGGGAACFFDNMELMNQKGETVYLKASAAELTAYLRTASKDRPLLAQKSEEELFDFISGMLEKREPFYSQAKYTVDARDVSDEMFDGLMKNV
jgi:shikimate kinase